VCWFAKLAPHCGNVILMLLREYDEYILIDLERKSRSQELT
jgi:hypothetical protein